ncbi:lysophospholipid acyltransferase family protein [Sutterella sp.]|uniref:lysophospholipid acyltransferase family protein n=1 Tax=Sutterella sp. TaxID=1981025 RepID=UPI0026E00E0A|nr:lysophospholipid acyltransferase family protein [Sutterella sp.]MDO5532128.1 lysophospholipid acyltransferase family protein [Sutterella sp.]
MQWLIALVAKLPLGFLQFFGAVVGEITFWVSPGYRRRTRENLRAAGYTDDKHLFPRVGRNAGRQAMESAWVWYRPVDTVMKHVHVAPGVEEMIGEAMRSKQPIVFMTPHVGCFEVLPVWLAATFFEETGRNITILFRPPRKRILQNLVKEARQAPGIEAVPTNVTGVKHVIRNLRKGHTFGALPDQVPSNGDGVWANFFGRPAWTMTLPNRVAKQFDAVRIFAWGIRSGDGWRLEAERWDEPLTGDPAADARAMNRKIEEIIRRMPEQYAWSYNRYKRPAGTPPPESITAEGSAP